MSKRFSSNIFFFILATSFLITAACDKTTNQENTWSAYKADGHSSSYSPLDQINSSNVGQLTNAWTFEMTDLAQGEDPVSSQSNPIIVDGGSCCLS